MIDWLIVAVKVIAALVAGYYLWYWLGEWFKG
jgi:hypothetical protein